MPHTASILPPSSSNRSLESAPDRGHSPIRATSSNSTFAPPAEASASLRSPPERFVDNFFHESNIKWMLLVGAAIVFGSSLMLVTRQWAYWSPALKCLTILGYTATIYVIAEVCKARFLLKKTSTVLHGLTLLLLPVYFLAVSWLVSDAEKFDASVGLLLLGLMCPAIALAWYAATRTFDQWLRGRQTTFLISYLVLCVACVLPVISNTWLAAAATAVFWGVMTMGVVKVNRHLFWLVEEYRWPRVFGFLPIGMLSLQFVILTAMKTASSFSLEWLGFECVLVAGTVLMTAREVANVFRMRTGDLVRPLPWNLVAPLFIGLTLVALGVVLAFHGFSYVGTTTYAAVPTTLLAAVLILIAAHDTRQIAFVWIALVLITVVYQCTPTLATEAVRQLKAASATAINESRLPLAFYGLTYLPLMLSFAMGSRLLAARKRFEFSRPMKHLVTLIALGLFLAATTHLKATFIVSVVNIGLFYMLAVIFRDRRFVLPALVAMLLATITSIPFVKSMQWIALSNEHVLTSLCGLAMLLTISRNPDRLTNRIGLSDGRWSALFLDRGGQPRELVHSFGQAILALASIACATLLIVHFHRPWSQATGLQLTMLIGLWILQVLRTRHYLAGLSLWLLAAVASVTLLVGWQMPVVDVSSIVTVAAAVLSFVLSLIIRHVYARDRSALDWHRIRRELGFDTQMGRFVEVASLGSASRGSGDTSLPDVPLGKRDVLVGLQPVFGAIAVPLLDLALVTMTALVLYVHVPLIAYANGVMQPLMMPLASSVAIAWVIAMSLVFSNRSATVGAVVMLPFWSAAIVNHVFPNSLTHDALPLVWSIVAALTACVLSRLENSAAEAGRTTVIGWFSVVVAISVCSFELPIRAAAVVALIGLASFHTVLSSRFRLAVLIVLFNVQVLFLAAYLGGARGGLLPLVEQFANLDSVICWLMPALGAGVLVLERNWTRLDPSVIQSWTRVQRMGFLFCSALSFGLSDLTVLDSTLVLCGFAIAALVEFRHALRTQQETHVWSCFAMVAVGIAWMVGQQFIVLGVGISQIALIGTAVASLLLARMVRGHAMYGVAESPLEKVGLTFPAIVTVLATFAEWNHGAPVWRGMNSLLLFSAAGLYFHRGVTLKQNSYVAASALILNVGIALLWRSLGMYDAQLYLVPLGLSILGLVEIMNRELPNSSHTPLRYVGALTILVSPSFDILGGSWLHLVTLMVLCVLVILLAIGLRLRALVNTGSAFLLADLVAMVVRSSLDNPNLLWLCGLIVGVAVISLAAVCENHRERLLARVRLLSAELATWR